MILHYYIQIYEEEMENRYVDTLEFRNSFIEEKYFSMQKMVQSDTILSILPVVCSGKLSLA